MNGSILTINQLAQAGTVCEAIKAMLETYHHRVLVADNAIEALALFAAYSIPMSGLHSTDFATQAKRLGFQGFSYRSRS